eukprot:g11564.t1
MKQHPRPNRRGWAAGKGSSFFDFLREAKEQTRTPAGEEDMVINGGTTSPLYNEDGGRKQNTPEPSAAQYFFRFGPLYEYDTIICRSEGSAAAVVRGASTLPSVFKTTLPDGDLCPWHATAYTKYHIAAFEAARRARRPEQKILILGASKTAVDKNPVIRKAAQNLGTVVLSECREVAPGTLREHEKPQGAPVTLNCQAIQPAAWQTEINDEDDMEAENGASVEDDNRVDDLTSKWEDELSATEAGLLKKIRSNTRNAFAST